MVDVADPSLPPNVPTADSAPFNPPAKLRINPIDPVIGLIRLPAMAILNWASLPITPIRPPASSVPITIANAEAAILFPDSHCANNASLPTITVTGGSSLSPTAIAAAPNPSFASDSCWLNVPWIWLQPSTLPCASAAALDTVSIALLVLGALVPVNINATFSDAESPVALAIAPA